MKVKVLMFCLTSCLALAATADAQPGGGGGRGGGRGGFGGGMMGGRGGSIFRVVENEAVQKDMNLSTDDAAKVKTVVDAYREAVGPFPNFRDLSEDERTKAMEKFTATVKTTTETYLPKLKDALSSDQFTRLQQIYWQSLRTAALSEAEVIKAISISKEQQEKIKTVNADHDAKRTELMTASRAAGGGPEAFQANMEKFQALDKEREMKINEILTKEQQDKFASLKGKEFDLAELRGGGPGGPGGGGGGGGGGGRQKRPQPKVE